MAPDRVNPHTDITRDYNLTCKNGHIHWSPEPEKWVGKECLTPMVRDGKSKARCHEAVRMIGKGER